MKIYLVTTSQFKVNELQDSLKAFQARTPLNIELFHVARRTREILTSDIPYIVRNKALEAYEYLANRCLVEHSGLFIDALPNLPGAVGQIIWDAVGDQMCGFVSPGIQRGATARSILGYCDGRRVRLYQGEMRGQVAERSRGDYNCNWDPIFIPEGSNLTYGEMGLEGKRETSPTVKAFEAFLRAEFSGEKHLS